MMIRTALMQFPAPAFLAAAVPQVAPQLVEGAEGWLAVFLLGVWVTIVYLEKIGKLPGGKPETPTPILLSFNADDARRLKEVHGLMTFRREDGTERFVHHGVLLQDVATELRSVARKLDHLAEKEKKI